MGILNNTFAQVRCKCGRLLRTALVERNDHDNMVIITVDPHVCRNTNRRLEVERDELAYKFKHIKSTVGRFQEALKEISNEEV